MLVLALQFSKGDAQRLPASWERTGATTRTLDQYGSGRCGSGARELMPCGEASNLRKRRVTRTGVDSLKTEEKTRTVDSRSRGGRILTTLDDVSTDPTMHQLGTGSNRTGQMPAND